MYRLLWVLHKQFFPKLEIEPQCAFFGTFLKKNSKLFTVCLLLHFLTEEETFASLVNLYGGETILEDLYPKREKLKTLSWISKAWMGKFSSFEYSLWSNVVINKMKLYLPDLLSKIQKLKIQV
jgi:hypothetical protein